MKAIVSLLDEEHWRRTTDLWAELEREFGLRGVYITPFPHFSYHVAQVYDEDELGLILEQIARHLQVFQIRASGLGIFSGSPPVLYAPIVRTRELSEFHDAMWHHASQVARGTVAHYDPDNWLPHITLAFGDIHRDNLPQVIRLLSERSLQWRIAVDNLAYIERTGEGQRVRFRFEFGG